LGVPSPSAARLPGGTSYDDLATNPLHSVIGGTLYRTGIRFLLSSLSTPNQFPL